MFKYIFLNKIGVSIQFVPESLIDDNSALFPVMAWWKIGDKPLPEPMMIRFSDMYL